MEYTYRWLKAPGIEPVGSALSFEDAHRGVVLTRHGLRFGFLAYTYDQSNGNWRDIDPRIANDDVNAMRHDVSLLRTRCDVVIVSMHNGIEYQPRPNDRQRIFAHAAIDAGALLVVGHHPHVRQVMERYCNGVIFYSLGNFIFDQYQRQETQWGAIGEVKLLGANVECARMI